MKVVVAFFISVILVAGVVLLTLGDSYEITNYPAKEGEVVAFGDSLVYGVGSEESEGFVGLLSQKLRKDIVNLGVPGDTTKDGLDRLDEVLELEPSVVFVLLGGNDRLKQISQEETLLNLKEIISSIQETSAMVVLLGVKGNIFSDRFDNELKAVARETGAVFVPDVLDGVIGNSDFMFDSIHPNREGYEIIAEKVFQNVTKYLTNL